MPEQDMAGELRNELGRQRAEERHDRARDRAASNAERARAHANHDAPFGGKNPLESAAVRADFRAMLGVAMVEATNRASASLEAEHLLLAFLFDRTSPATQLLAEHGLTYETFAAALETERQQTLAAIGISIPDPERLKAAPRPLRMGGPRFSTSAKEVWERTSRRARARRGRAQRITAADFFHSFLTLELGTVPRALARAGFDRMVLLAALEPAAASID